MTTPATQFIDMATSGQDFVEFNPYLFDTCADPPEKGKSLPIETRYGFLDPIEPWQSDRTQSADLQLALGARNLLRSSARERDAVRNWDAICIQDPRVGFFPRFPASTDQLAASSFVERLCELNFNSWLENATDISTIVAALRFRKLHPLADRIVVLDKFCEEDPTEPSIEVDSLRYLALFMVTELRFPKPRVAVSPDGLMQIEWRIPEDGIVAVKFLNNGQLQFAAISGSKDSRFERQHISGTHWKKHALNAIRSFIPPIQFEI